MTRTVAFNMIQLLFVIGFAPLYSGVLSRFKEHIQSKLGPSIFQPYRDLWKLFHKDEVVSEETTWIFRVTPYLVFVIPLFVTTLIPVLTDYPLAFAFMGDMLAGGFFLGLAGFFAALAAVDTGNPYGPMGASRTRMVGFLASHLKIDSVALQKSGNCAPKSLCPAAARVYLVVQTTLHSFFLESPITFIKIG
jgi:formate hydrogenlyase subunit 4